MDSAPLRGRELLFSWRVEQTGPKIPPGGRRGSDTTPVTAEVFSREFYLDDKQ